MHSLWLAHPHCRSLSGRASALPLHGWGSCLSPGSPSWLPFGILSGTGALFLNGSFLASVSVSLCAKSTGSVHCLSAVYQGPVLCDLPALLLFPTSCFSFQLNLIHSEISNLAGFEVEAIINPTNADIDLKDDLGNWGRGLHHQLSGESYGTQNLGWFIFLDFGQSRKISKPKTNT